MRKFGFLMMGSILALSVTASADELSMTIYGNNQTLVEDVRAIDFDAGEQVIVLPGVSSQIQSPTVSLNAGNMEIIEQNFDFDLLSPAKLMEKAVGQYVRIVRTNPATGVETREKVKVLSVNNGVVIQNGTKIEVLRDDNIPTRVVFDEVPVGLKARPTLSVTVDSALASRRDATLTYLTRGISWRGDYVAVFDEAAGHMSLQGWATINNQTETGFEEAELSVVAGHIGGGNSNRYNRGNNYNSPQRGGGTQPGTAERIGDNYIYPLPGKTTLASRQSKQISFLDADRVQAVKSYEFYPGGMNTMNAPKGVDSRIAFSNSAETGMGEAMPAGTVRVYAKDKAGRAQFIGENTVPHMAAGSDISMKIGSAFDITVQSTIVRQRKVSNSVTETEMKYAVRNAKPEAVIVKIFVPVQPYYYKYEMLSESLPSVETNAYMRVWSVDVPANSSEDLTFKMRVVRN